MSVRTITAKQLRNAYEYMVSHGRTQINLERLSGLIETADVWDQNGRRLNGTDEKMNDCIETANLERFGDRQFAAILSAMSEESCGYEYVFVSTRKVEGKFKPVVVRTYYSDVLKEAVKRIMRHDKKEGEANHGN